METKKLEWNELWDAMEAAPEEWIETTEAMYWEMMGALPPRKMTRAAFLVGEPLRHNHEGRAVYSCFTRLGDTYKAKNLTTKQFDEVFL